jgi:hypothetical protein
MYTIMNRMLRLKKIIEPLEKYSDEDLEIIMDNVEENRVLFYRILERYVQYRKEEGREVEE